MSNTLEELYDKMLDEAPFNFKETNKPYIFEFAKLYAEACCKASLEKASDKVTSNWICDNCNEDFTLLENPTSLQTCPHCKKSNHIWIKVNKDSIDIQSNIVIL